MPFNYLEERRGSKGKEKSGPAGPEEEEAEDAPQEKVAQRDPVEKKPVDSLREREKSDPENVCEVCQKEMGTEKPATRKVPMSGREVWLCDLCLQAAGFDAADS